MLPQVCLVRRSLDQIDNSFVCFTREVFSLHNMLSKLLDPKQFCSEFCSQEYKVDLIVSFRSLITKHDESLSLQANQIELQLTQVKLELDKINYGKEFLLDDYQSLQPVVLVDRILWINFQRLTSQAEKAVIEGIFDGLTYAQIAERANYSSEYLSRNVAPNLFQLLTEVLGYRVSKKNFCAALKFYISELSAIQTC